MHAEGTTPVFFRSAGLPIVIPPDHALAIKAELSILWSKLRVIRRQVNQHGRSSGRLHQFLPALRYRHQCEGL